MNLIIILFLVQFSFIFRLFQFKVFDFKFFTVLETIYQFVTNQFFFNLSYNGLLIQFKN